jgi:transposase InsO family protein
MSIANPLWGAPRIHGELLKLGIDVGQTTVAKYMAKRRWLPSQDWKSFLYNHADSIALMDLFVVPISFRLLYGLLILQHARRELLWLAVTAHPTTECMARQVTEAFGWRQAPCYLVPESGLRLRDRVRAAHSRAMGIRDRPISARSPWQNGYAERLIGSVRRECLDHVVVFGERHLRNLLAFVPALLQRMSHSPVLGQGCAVCARGDHPWPYRSQPVLGGLHHRYCRI